MLITLEEIGQIYKRNPNISADDFWIELCKLYLEANTTNLFFYDHIELIKQFIPENELIVATGSEEKQSSQNEIPSFIIRLNFHFTSHDLDTEDEFANLLRVYVRCYPEHYIHFNESWRDAIAPGDLLLPMSDEEITEFHRALGIGDKYAWYKSYDLNLYCDMFGQKFIDKVMPQLISRLKKATSSFARDPFERALTFDLIASVSHFIREKDKSIISGYFKSILISKRNNVFQDVDATRFIVHRFYAALRTLQSMISPSDKTEMIQWLVVNFQAFKSIRDSEEIAETLLLFGYRQAPLVYELVEIQLKRLARERGHNPSIILFERDELISVLQTLDKSALTTSLIDRINFYSDEVRPPTGFFIFCLLHNIEYLDQFIDEEKAQLFYETVLKELMNGLTSSLASRYYFRSVAFIFKVQHRYTKIQIDRLIDQITLCLDLDNRTHANSDLTDMILAIKSYLNSTQIRQFSQKMIEQFDPQQQYYLSNGFVCTLDELHDVIPLDLKQQYSDKITSALKDITIDETNKIGILANISQSMRLFAANEIEPLLNFLIAMPINNEDINNVVCQCLQAFTIFYPRLPIDKPIINKLVQIVGQLNIDLPNYQKEAVVAMSALAKWLLLAPNDEELKTIKNSFAYIIETFCFANKNTSRRHDILQQCNELVVTDDNYNVLLTFVLRNRSCIHAECYEITSLAGRFHYKLNDSGREYFLSSLADIRFKTDGSSQEEHRSTSECIATRVINENSLLQPRNYYSFGIFGEKSRQVCKELKANEHKTFVESVQSWWSSSVESVRSRLFRSGEGNQAAQIYQTENFNKLYHFRLFNVMAETMHRRHVEIELAKYKLPKVLQKLVFEYEDEVEATDKPWWVKPS